MLILPDTCCIGQTTMDGKVIELPRYLDRRRHSFAFKHYITQVRNIRVFDVVVEFERQSIHVRCATP